MLISRTPFRISFVGGGSDLESYYKYNGGAVISSSIDKYIYLTSHEYFEKPKSILKYSKTEIVRNQSDIEHPIIRAVFERYGLSGIDFSSIADIPAGTGMGSSSSFTVGLVTLFNQKLNLGLSKIDIAESACDIEINILNEPIGKQDQYAACFGGLNLIEFDKNGNTTVSPYNLSGKNIKMLNDNLFLVYTGIRRSASSILKNQKKQMGSIEKRKILDKMVKLTYDLNTSFLSNQVENLGPILHENWMLKKSITQNITDNFIDELYNLGMKCGATGGKLLGAGAGGFLLFYVPQQMHSVFKDFFNEKLFSFNLENLGSTIIFNDEG